MALAHWREAREGVTMCQPLRGTGRPVPSATRVPGCMRVLASPALINQWIIRSPLRERARCRPCPSLVHDTMSCDT